MNRKGFTLVEMLAVIVLIALLAVIGIGTYTNVNESAKQKTLESKKEQIRSSALKWAKENNISNKTILSVNTLVVEGYLTADENEVGKIGLIENPVTGENMICNTVDITLKDGEYIAVVNDTAQNCTLATQSLVDTNISIKVVDAKNKPVTGSSSIAAWTNQNVMIIVSSSSYDSRATSISYDFEGNTVTKQKSGKQKYTGNAYVKEEEAGNYYNVFHINANLILNTKIVVTYNIAGESTKSRAYTIRIDKEEATAIVDTNSEWTTTDKKITVKTDDGKGSGPRYFYITTTDNAADRNASNRYNATGYDKITKKLEIGKYYVWTEDRAGNVSTKPKVVFEVNNTDPHQPKCNVIFDGTEGEYGWFRSPVVVKASNVEPAGISGVNIGASDSTSPEYTAYAPYNTTNTAIGPTRSTETTRSGVNYYCHVKSIAGNGDSKSRNLKIDMTPPTVTVTPSSNAEYVKHQLLNITFADSLSGLSDPLRYYQGWAEQSSTPDSYTYIDSYVGTNNNTLFTANYNTGTPPNATGIYYYWLKADRVQDIAGNKATGISGGGTKIGPFYVDNTPPVCGTSNSKTNWTKGGYTVTIKCSDDEGTTDQSGCTQDEYTKVFTSSQTVQDSTITIEDKAGNKRDCPIQVYIDNRKPTCGAASGDSTSWTRSDRTVSVGCSDAQSGCTSSSFSKTWSSTTTTSSIQIRDNVGNTRNCSVNVYVDKTNPSCSTNKTSTGKGGVSGTISCSDSHSGVGSCNGGTTTFSGLKSGATYSVSDKVGNSNSCSVSVSSYGCDCTTKEYNAAVDVEGATCTCQALGGICLTSVNSGGSQVTGGGYWHCVETTCASTCYE